MAPCCRTTQAWRRSGGIWVKPRRCSFYLGLISKMKKALAHFTNPFSVPLFRRVVVVLSKMRKPLLLSTVFISGCYMYSVGPSISSTIQSPDNGWKMGNNTIYKSGVSIVVSLGRDRSGSAYYGEPFQAHVCINSKERLVFDYQNFAIVFDERKYDGRLRHVNALWDYDADNYDSDSPANVVPVNVVTGRNPRCYYYDFDLSTPNRRSDIKLRIPNITRLDGMINEEAPVVIISYEPATPEVCFIPGCFVSH